MTGRMVAMTSWFRRRQQQESGASTPVVIPRAWRYGGPTSDTASASSSLSSLTAAAARVGGKGADKDEARRLARGNERAGEAWDMYDQVGELRYVANAIAGRMGQAELYTEVDGKRQDPDDDPILALITSQMTERLGLNLFVAGGGWLIGLPKGEKEGRTNSEWIICSTIEVKESGQKTTIRGKEYDTNKVYMQRIWDPHPAVWEQPDSPVLSALPVLREIVGLTQHISAQIDSRLAGAGVYWIPNEILSNPKVPANNGQQNFSDNPVLNAIMNAMLLPMEDRSNASSVVPLLLGAPGDWIDKIRFDSFATPFDENTKELLDGAIRRLALNLDAPPELLLGMGDSNHWAAWLVRDEVVQIHVSPRLDLVTDAYTTAFYRPILTQLQKADDNSLPAYLKTVDPENVDVKADVSGLVQRPNRLADASQLHAVNAINDKALRDAGGFEETDAPSSNERAIALALQVGAGNPQLLDNLPEIVAAIKAVLDGSPETGPGVVQSQREAGSLRPLVPANATNPAVTTTPEEAKPLAEQDTLPRAGAPV